MNKKPTLIQFWGGPGSGKSIGACSLYTLMAISPSYEEVGLVREFAKKYAILRDREALSDQRFITGGQAASLYIAKLEYKTIISDSAIELGRVYCSDSKDLEFIEKTISEVYSDFNVVNVFIRRNFDLAFEEAGRVHNLKESMEIDAETCEMAQAAPGLYLEWTTSRNIYTLFTAVDAALRKNSE